MSNAIIRWISSSLLFAFSLCLSHTHLKLTLRIMQQPELMISLNLMIFQMLEIGTCMELMEKSAKPTEKINSEFVDDISFEELLAQEKKDSFW